MNTAKKIICLALCICLIFTCVSTPRVVFGDNNIATDANASMQNQKKILFIGNSFTYYSKKKIGIEPILKSIASANNENLYIKTVANDGAYLSYYSDLTLSYQDYHHDAMKEIMETQWDYIVLQDNTTAPVQCYESEMEPSVSKLMDYIEAYQENAKVLMYFPAAYNVTSLGMSAHDLQMYTSYAMTRLKNKTGIEIAPVGLNASHFAKMYPDVSLIGTDNKHPNYAGYYLAAATFFYRIYGRVPQNTASQIKNCTLTDEQLTKINDAVDDSVMTLSMSSCNMNENQSVQLSTKGSKGNVNWYSLDSEIASVSPQGVVTALMPGRTAIIVEDENGFMDACEIAVGEAIINKLSFSRTKYLVGMGDQIQLLPQQVTHIPEGYFSWKSSNTSVAKVYNSGVVTAIKPGTVKISVSSKLNSAVSASYTLCIQCLGTKDLSYKITSKNSKTASVELSWKKSLGAKKYNIYRSLKSGSEYKLIGQSDKTSYIDKTAKVGVNYYYKVTAVAGDASTEGAYSNRVHVMVPAKVLKGQLKTGKTAYKLTWNKLSNVDGYEVYRAKTKKGKYVLVKTIKSKNTASYTDKDVKTLITANKKILAKAQKSKKTTVTYKTYYYKIRAYKIIDGKKYYGVYSDTVYLKTQKLSVKKSTTTKK